MADEQEAIAPPALETPASETPATETATTEPERIPSPGEETAPTEGEQPEVVEDEFEEFEWNGKPIKGPKGLKDGVLMHADYTKKTQTVAEKAKALESREAEINQRHEVAEAEIDARVQLRALDKTLEAYAALTQDDWDAHEANDPLGTQKHWRTFQMMQKERAALEANVTKASTERTEKAQQDLAKRVQDTFAEAPKIIPGWTPETANSTIQKLVEFAHSEGIPEQVLKSNWGPQLLKLLHRAQIGETTLQRQATAPKLPTTPVAPLTTVGGKGTPANRGDLASLDMDAYVAARKQGVGGKALR